jgi:molecular chaperone GrpE
MLKKIKDIMNKKDKNTSEDEIQDEMDRHGEAGSDQPTSNNEEFDKEVTASADPLAEKEQEIGELKDKYIRLLAEFENYKRRTIKERMELMDTAAQSTIVAMLPVLDDFDRAKTNAESKDSKEPFSEGVMLVYNKLYTILLQKGLKPMDSNGVDFDPEYHEAITEIPAPVEGMKGKVVDTVERGYMLKDKIIRYAKVVVGK